MRRDEEFAVGTGTGVEWKRATVSASSPVIKISKPVCLYFTEANANGQRTTMKVYSCGSI